MTSNATGIAANPRATIATASIHERTVILGTPIAWLRQLSFLDHAFHDTIVPRPSDRADYNRDVP